MANARGSGLCKGRARPKYSKCHVEKAHQAHLVVVYYIASVNAVDGHTLSMNTNANDDTYAALDEESSEAGEDDAAQFLTPEDAALPSLKYRTYRRGKQPPRDHRSDASAADPNPPETICPSDEELGDEELDAAASEAESKAAGIDADLASRWGELVMHDSRLRLVTLTDREKRAVLLCLPHLPPTRITTEKHENKRSRTFHPVIWQKELTVLDRIKFILQDQPLVAKAVLLNPTLLDDLDTMRRVLAADEVATTNPAVAAHTPTTDAEACADANVDVSPPFRSWCNTLDDAADKIKGTILRGVCPDRAPGSERTDADALFEACGPERNNYGGAALDLPLPPYTDKRRSENHRVCFRWQLRYIAHVIQNASQNGLDGAAFPLDDLYTRIGWMTNFLRQGRINGGSPSTMYQASVALQRGIQWRQSRMREDLCNGSQSVTPRGTTLEMLEKFSSAAALLTKETAILKRQTRELAATRPKRDRILSISALSSLSLAVHADLHAFATSPAARSGLDAFIEQFANAVLEARLNKAKLNTSRESRILTELRYAGATKGDSLRSGSLA